MLWTRALSEPIDASHVYCQLQCLVLWQRSRPVTIPYQLDDPNQCHTVCIRKWDCHIDSVAGTVGELLRYGLAAVTILNTLSIIHADQHILGPTWVISNSIVDDHTVCKPNNHPNGVTDKYRTSDTLQHSSSYCRIGSGHTVPYCISSPLDRCFSRTKRLSQTNIGGLGSTVVGNTIRRTVSQQ